METMAAVGRVLGDDGWRHSGRRADGGECPDAEDLHGELDGGLDSGYRRFNDYDDVLP